MTNEEFAVYGTTYNTMAKRKRKRSLPKKKKKKSGCELVCFWGISSSWSTYSIYTATLVTNPMKNRQWVKYRIAIAKSENINVVICDTDITYWLTRSWWRPWNVRSDDFNLTNRNSWFGRFLVRNNHLSKVELCSKAMRYFILNTYFSGSWCNCLLRKQREQNTYRRPG